MGISDSLHPLPHHTLRPLGFSLSGWNHLTTSHASETPQIVLNSSQLNINSPSITSFCWQLFPKYFSNHYLLPSQPPHPAFQFLRLVANSPSIVVRPSPVFLTPILHRASTEIHSKCSLAVLLLGLTFFRERTTNRMKFKSFNKIHGAGLQPPHSQLLFHPLAT